jgi:hypothetical protein
MRLPLQAVLATKEEAHTIPAGVRNTLSGE